MTLDHERANFLLCLFLNAKYVAVTTLGELAILFLRKQFVKLFPLITLYLKSVSINIDLRYAVKLGNTNLLL